MINTSLPKKWPTRNVNHDINATLVSIVAKVQKYISEDCVRDQNLVQFFARPAAFPRFLRSYNDVFISEM